MEYARVDKDLHWVIDQSGVVFDSFVNRLGGELVNSFCVGLEQAYSDNLVYCVVVLTHVLSLVLRVYPSNRY